MPELDANELAAQMHVAADRILNDKHAEAHIYAHGAFRTLADVLVQIYLKQTSGKLTPGHARIMLRIGKNTALSVLLAVKGLPAQIAESAIRAALDAVREQVNSALGWRLL